MDRIARRTIDKKLTRTILLTTGVGLLLACGAFVAYDVVTLRRSMVEDTRTLARVIAINSAVPLSFIDADAARETLSALSAARNVLGASIYRADGQQFAEYRVDSPRSAMPARPPPGPSGHRFHDLLLDLHHEIVMEGRVVGKIIIRADTRELTARIERYGLIVCALFLAVAAAAAAASSRLRREVAVPLKELVEGSKAVAGGNLSAHVAVVTDDEIGVLADTFNAMMAIPNLIALALLSPVVFKLTRDYFAGKDVLPGEALDHDK